MMMNIGLSGVPGAEPVPGTVSTNTIWAPDAFVIGKGTEFTKYFQPGDNKIDIDGTKATVALVNSDTKLTLMQNWDGETVTDGTLSVVRDVPPGIDPKTGKPIKSAAAKWITPLVILVVLGVTGYVGYRLYKRHKARKQLS